MKGIYGPYHLVFIGVHVNVKGISISRLFGRQRAPVGGGDHHAFHFRGLPGILVDVRRKSGFLRHRPHASGRHAQRETPPLRLASRQKAQRPTYRRHAQAEAHRRRQRLRSVAKPREGDEGVSYICPLCLIRPIYPTIRT